MPPAANRELPLLPLGLVGLVLAGGVAWHASIPAPLGPAAGTTLEGAKKEAVGTPTARRTLRLATFNIHGGKGTDGRRDLGRTAAGLEGLDFVALQEVQGPWLWEQLDQAARLGHSLNMAWLFAPNTRVWHHRDSGNGLLSAAPVDSWQRIPLPNYGGRGYRNAVLAGLPCGRGTLHVLLTHVSRANDNERRRQLRAVIDLYLALREPAVLLGDLNSDAADPDLARLLARPGLRDALAGTTAGRDRRRIDWIITRGLRTLRAGVRDNGASDHPLVWAEVELEEPR